jgi:diacylglycerol kinase family enzyme
VRAAPLYATSELRELDVGTAAGIPFLMMLTVGVDSTILRRATQAAKKRFGRLAVAAQAMAAMIEYDSPLHTLAAGDRRAAGSFLAASNIRYYGGPFEITPGADPLDGVLDFVVFSGRGRLAMLKLALDVFTGTHLARGDFATWKAAAGRIEGKGEVWVQIDGDPMRLALPIEIGLAPERLSILLPTQSSGRQR